MNKTDKIKINNKIKQIIDKKLYIDIYHIVKNDDNFKPSLNNNGVYFNLNLLNEITLIKIENLINNYIPTDDKNKLSYTSYYNETEEEKLNKKLIALNFF